MEQEAPSPPQWRSRWRLLLVAATGLTLAVVTPPLLRHNSTEVSWQGKSLSAWVDDFDARDTSDSLGWNPLWTNLSPAHVRAAAALRGMGRDAVPGLLILLHRDQSSFRRGLAKLLVMLKLPPKGIDNSKAQRWRAAEGVLALGSEGRSALPALAADQERNRHSKWVATALAGIGGDAVLTLTNSFTNKVDWTSICSLWAIGQMRLEPAKTTPGLLMCLTNSNLSIRLGAAWAFSQLRAEPEIVVPALMQSVADSFSIVRHHSLDALGAYGTNAIAALGVISNALNDTDGNVTNCARKALEAITGSRTNHSRMPTSTTSRR